MRSREFAALSARLRSFSGNLALIGTGKNAGKTTVFNFLLSEFPQPPSGVTSIGRDGERMDVLAKHAKPAIFAPSGTVFATASDCLERGRGRYSVLERTSMATPLGPVVICRAEERCRLELAGPSQVDDLTRVSRRMRELGAARVWIDGAFDRVAAAASRLSDAVLLAAGSSDRVSVEDSAKAVHGYVRRFQLPLRPQPSGDCGDWVELPSLTDARLMELEGAKVLIPDPASCLIDEAGWRFLDSGRCQVFVRGRPELLAVFTSPFRPHLPPLDAVSLLARVRELCQNVPVFDLKLEGFL